MMWNKVWLKNIFIQDIKSTNILLDKHMEPKIGDFGLAKPCHGNQENDKKIIVGTR